MENIYITKTMFDEINRLFGNEKFKNYYYNIISFRDLNNTRITNFYFLLFKYILKNPIYIYHIFLFYMKQREI